MITFFKTHSYVDRKGDSLFKDKDYLKHVTVIWFIPVLNAESLVHTASLSDFTPDKFTVE